MIVKNNTKKDLPKMTFRGFEFTVPIGIHAMWSPAAKYFTTKIYRKEALTVEDKGGTSPLVEVSADQWDGKSYAQVTRYQIDYTRIPNRNDLLRIAKQRGVNRDFLESAQEDGETVTNKDIVSKINELPIPEDILIPETRETK